MGGHNASFENNLYSHTAEDKNFTFKTLSEIRTALNHTSRDIDLLKFDIEGFEWVLFEKDLLPSDTLPTQLSFELHTYGSRAIPSRTIGGKGFLAVNKLCLD